MYRFSLLIFLGFLTVKMFATSITASSFGWNGINDTSALQQAFTANVDTLYIDLQAGNWISGPLIFDNSVNDKVVIFEKNVTIEALPGAFDGYLYNGLFTFINCSNISFQGYGATLKMNKQEYIDLNDGSEWRHVISISGCNNFSIFGLELIDSGGDGIEISGLWQQPVPSTNIHIKDCKINNNYRQGISITSAENVLIEHCKITNTEGTPPAFGIDLEPDMAYDVLNNIQIKQCRITGNEGGGVLVALWMLDETSQPVDVTVEDCYIGSNQNQGIVIDVNSSGPVPGQVLFSRCLIENQPGNAIFSNKRESLLLEFNDLVIKNVGTAGGSYDMPVFIQKQYDYSGLPLGNILFNNIYIDDRFFTRDFLDITHWGGSSQVENVSGNFFIYNPNGVSSYVEAPWVNVTFTQQTVDTLPLADLSVSTYNNTAYETGNDNTASFTVERTDSDFSFPLGVYFNVTGTAQNRLDYSYFTKMLIIPSNAASTTYTFTALPDLIQEPQETIDVTISPNDHYTTTTGNVQLYIEDELLSVSENNTTPVTLFPNPAKNNITVSDLNSDEFFYEIFDLSGQQIIKKKPVSLHTINVEQLSSGTYFLLLHSGLNKTTFIKFIKE